MRKIIPFVIGLLAAFTPGVHAQQISQPGNPTLANLGPGTVPASTGTFAFGANPVTGSAFTIGGNFDGVVGANTPGNGFFTNTSATGTATVTGAFTVGGNAAASATIQANAADLSNRLLNFNSAGLSNWKLGANTSNNFVLNNYTPSTGVLIDSPWNVVQGAGGLITFARPTTITGLLTGNLGATLNGGSITLNTNASANTTGIGTGNTTGAITIGGGSDAIQINAAAKLQDTGFTTNAGTTNFTLGNNWHTIDTDGSVQASLTVTMPASPSNGQMSCFSNPGAVITSLTTAPNSGQSMVGTITALSFAAGSGFCYQYQTSNTTWYRIQ